MDEAILNSWCDFMIQFTHPSYNTPPIFIYNNFLCTEPHFVSPRPAMKDVQILAHSFAPLSSCVPVPSPRGVIPASQWVRLMENRLLLPGGGFGGRRLHATVARIATTMAKGRQLHIAVTIPHPLPSPRGVTQKGLSFVWCGWNAKNNKYGLKKCRV